MERFFLDRDIPVFYVTANSFPEGITEAHERLDRLLPANDKRTFFGISRPEGNAIVYRVAVEEVNAGEGGSLGCNTMTIQKGAYISMTVSDYIKHPHAIANAFQNLITQPTIDPNGYCVECYLEPNLVRCMVRMKD